MAPKLGTPGLQAGEHVSEEETVARAMACAMGIDPDEQILWPPELGPGDTCIDRHGNLSWQKYRPGWVAYEDEARRLIAGMQVLIKDRS